MSILPVAQPVYMVAESVVVPKIEVGSLVECSSVDDFLIKGLVVGAYWENGDYTDVISCPELDGNCICFRQTQDKNKYVVLIQDERVMCQVLKRLLKTRQVSRSSTHSKWKNLYPTAYEQIEPYLSKIVWAWYLRIFK
jgi:hypothetical protein